MLKKVSILVLITFLFLTLLSPGPVQGQNGLTILDSSAQADFPNRLNFHLSAESSVEISDIRLRYRVNRSSFAQVTSEVFIEFVPTTTVDISWTLDMVKINGLPPGSNIEYWWVIKDAAKNKTETDPDRVKFDDNRYPWKSITDGELTLYWYKGEEPFAQGLMATAQQALARLATYTGAYLEKSANIFIYANSDDLRGAMIHPQEWTGGVAFTRYSTTAISIPPGDFSWSQKVIPHELTHLVIDQMTLNPFSDLPTWLAEGLAMYIEGPLDPTYTAYLYRAITQNSLISVRSLSSPFSAYAKEAALSYAQSYSLVDFLITNYGQGKMLELLNTFKQGSGYDDALKKVYGFDMDGLDILWRDSVKIHAKPISLKAMQLLPVETLATLNTWRVPALSPNGKNRLGG